MAAAPTLNALLGALTGELHRMHADALRLQDDLSALADSRAALEKLQALDAFTQGLEALGGFARGLAAVAPAGAVELAALERPGLSDMAGRLGWPVAAPAVRVDADEGCELF